MLWFAVAAVIIFGADKVDYVQSPPFKSKAECEAWVKDGHDEHDVASIYEGKPVAWIKVLCLDQWQALATTATMVSFHD